MEFRVGEKVVYPNHGVGIIEQVTSRSVNGIPEEFYMLRIHANSSLVMVPTANVKSVGMRKIIRKVDCEGLFKLLEEDFFEPASDWKGRYKQNLDKMKSGRLQDIADVLKTLNYISARKTLSFREKKMYERARYLIISEIAVINGMDEGDVERQVDRALAKSAQMRNAQIRTPELRASH